MEIIKLFAVIDGYGDTLGVFDNRETANAYACKGYDIKEVDAINADGKIYLLLSSNPVQINKMYPARPHEIWPISVANEWSIEQEKKRNAWHRKVREFVRCGKKIDAVKLVKENEPCQAGLQEALRIMNEIVNEKEKPCTIAIDIQPSFIEINPLPRILPCYCGPVG